MTFNVKEEYKAFLGIEFSKKLGRGLFGGEGFIMQKLEGDGMAFVHAGGTLAKKELAAGETLKVEFPEIKFNLGFRKIIDKENDHGDSDNEKKEEKD